jgi:hypothetical protein
MNRKGSLPAVLVVLALSQTISAAGSTINVYSDDASLVCSTRSFFNKNVEITQSTRNCGGTPVVECAALVFRSARHFFRDVVAFMMRDASMSAGVASVASSSCSKSSIAMSGY